MSCLIPANVCSQYALIWSFLFKSLNMNLFCKRIWKTCLAIWAKSELAIILQTSCSPIIKKSHVVKSSTNSSHSHMTAEFTPDIPRSLWNEFLTFWDHQFHNALSIYSYMSRQEIWAHACIIDAKYMRDDKKNTRLRIIFS